MDVAGEAGKERSGDLANRRSGATANGRRREDSRPDSVIFSGARVKIRATPISDAPGLPDG